MRGLLLFSILIATFAVPTLATRQAEPRRALRLTVVGMLGVELGYAVFLFFFYERLF